MDEEPIPPENPRLLTLRRVHRKAHGCSALLIPRNPGVLIQADFALSIEIPSEGLVPRKTSNQPIHSLNPGISGRYQENKTLEPGTV